jgi:hypothetical protein
VSSNPAHGEVFLIQHYVMMFISDLRQVGGFLRVLRINSIRQHKDIKCVEKSIQLSKRNTPNFNNSVSLIDLSPPHLCANPICLLQHYVMMFISDLRQVGGFLRVLRFPPPIKLTATI